MKKFVCSLPLQTPRKTIYKTQDAGGLSYPRATAFPVVPMIYNAVEKGETIEVCVIQWGKVDTQNAHDNKALLQNEIRLLAQEKELQVHFHDIFLADEQTKKEHISLFQSLIKFFDSGDSVSVDITYGTKPTPVIVFAALNYAFKIKSNFNIEKIIYARYHFGEEQASLYDISSLFYLNDIVEKLSAENPAESEKVIRFLLDVSL